MKAKETITKILKNKVGRLVSTVLLLALLAAAVLLITNNYEPKVDTAVLLATLEESSELTTAKLTFRGLASYEDTGVKFLNRADYKMLYRATARIGIDVNEVEILKEPVGKSIIVKVPKAKMLDVTILTGKDDCIFYDEKFALFNFNAKEDHNAMLDLARKAAKQEIEAMGALKMADDQAAALIKGLLINAIPRGYKIVVEQK